MEDTPRISFANVDEYLSQQVEPQKSILIKLRKTIKKIIPNAEEIISYGMPAFKQGKVLLWYAGAKNHYAIYPYPITIVAFKDKLTKYKLSKGTIQFPLDKPVPEKLITEIVKFRLKENDRLEKIKKPTKK